MFGAGQYDGQFDILCITCGNTQAAKDIWKETHCDQKIRQWYEQGVIVTGYSAGFIIFFEWGSTDSVPGPKGARFGAMPCMGIIKGGAIPHIDTQPERIPDFQKFMTENPVSPVLALGEDVMACYRNEAFERALSFQPQPAAFWITQDRIERAKIQKTS